jgi:pimeloyl-ACP methyl ester carboxylesterase
MLYGCAGVPSAEPQSTVPEEPSSYDGAVRLSSGLIGLDANDPAIEPEALPLLYTHGKSVQRAVILFHGFTTCPKQFEELARRYFEQGCNVWVPRLPRHGHKDRLTRILAGLTVGEIDRCAQIAIWIARGIGASVSAVGLSLGGAMTMWLAQSTELDLAVPVSPFFVPKQFSEFTGGAAAHVLYAIPSMYLWWDDRLKAQCLPLYAYPGYPTHGLAELIFFGARILKRARATHPLGKRCALVTNVNDNAVNNAVPKELLAIWNSSTMHCTDTALTDLLPPRHDIIDPTTYPAAPTLVYPVLERLVLANS